MKHRKGHIFLQKREYKRGRKHPKRWAFPHTEEYSQHVIQWEHAQLLTVLHWLYKVNSFLPCKRSLTLQMRLECYFRWIRKERHSVKLTVVQCGLLYPHSTIKKFRLQFTNWQHNAKMLWGHLSRAMHQTSGWAQKDPNSHLLTLLGRICTSDGSSPQWEMMMPEPVWRSARKWWLKVYPTTHTQSLE